MKMAGWLGCNMFNKIKKVFIGAGWVVAVIMGIYIVATSKYIDTVTTEHSFIIEFKNPLSS